MKLPSPHLTSSILIAATVVSCAVPTRQAVHSDSYPTAAAFDAAVSTGLGPASASRSLQEAKGEAPRKQDGGAAKPAGGDSAAEVGKQLSDPVSDVWALFTEFDYQKNSGKLTGGGDSNTVGSSMIFQPIMPIPLTEDWKLITRPTLPVIFTTPVPDAGGDFDRESGIGNLTLPIIPASNHGIKLDSGTLIGGVGPTFGFPTASNDDLGADVWEAGVAAVGVYKTEKMTWIAFPQYWWSYSEDDAEDTSHGSMLYAAIYELGNAWQVGTTPTITYNHRASSGNEWNVPIGLLVAKTMTFGKRHIKFQLALEHSIVNEDDYGKEFLLRFNVIPVVANPFSGSRP